MCFWAFFIFSLILFSGISCILILIRAWVVLRASFLNKFLVVVFYCKCTFFRYKENSFCSYVLMCLNIFVSYLDTKHTFFEICIIFLYYLFFGIYFWYINLLKELSYFSIIMKVVDYKKIKELIFQDQKSQQKKPIKSIMKAQKHIK